MSAIRFLFSHMRRAMMMLAALLSLSAFSINIPRESYSYDIHYRFGPINCRIGHGDVAFSVVNNQLRGTLQGASIPWQGKIYTVRDTLCADMRILEGQKFSREHVTRKIGWYFKPSEQALKSGRYDYYVLLFQRDRFCGSDSRQCLHTPYQQPAACTSVCADPLCRRVGI